jgi:hypothetical protein
MASTVSAANLGGVADPRLGDEADFIGTSEEHRGGISGDIPPPDPHGHSTIYLDSSITFENYHYWTNRSREFEKHIRTDNAGLAQLGNILLGKKIPNEPPKLDSSEVTPSSQGVLENNEKKALSNEEASGNSDTGSKGGWSHGVTESEWEQAQRATRTATWGK